MPPFGRMVRLIARGPDEDGVVHDYLKTLADALRLEAADAAVRILGPAPAPDHQDPQPVPVPPPGTVPDRPARSRP